MRPSEIILQQIKDADPRALFAWGARDLKATENSLFFRVNGRNLNRGWIEVEYMEGEDAYTVRGFKKYKGRKVVKQEFDSVYVDGLIVSIDAIVG